MALLYAREQHVVTLSNESEGVILAPSTYWYVHAKFPTRSPSKAKRLADAFMDTRPENYNAIFVEKHKDGYDCYAYDAEALKSRLEEAGAGEAPVWFLQQFARQMPLRIDNERVAEAINGIVVELPDASHPLPALASLDPKTVAKPFNHQTESNPSIRLLLTLALLLATTATMDLGVRFQKYLAVQKALEQSRASRSIYEVRALVKRYEKVAAKQQKLRRNVANALKKGPLTKLSCTLSKGCDVE